MASVQELRREAGLARRPDGLDVEVAHVERVVLDELAARLDLIAHQRREHLIGLRVVLGAHLQQRAVRPDPSSSSRACPGSSRRGPCSG